MTSCIRKLLSLSLLVCAWSGVAWPAPPVGQFVVPFGPDQGIYDISGTYTYDDWTFTVAQDGKGKITGIGSKSGIEDGIDLRYAIRGSIATIGDITRVTLNFKITGNASSDVIRLPVKGTANFVLDINAAGDRLTGTGTLNLCVKKAGCATDTVPIDLAIPDGDGGSWTLTLNLQVAKGTTVAGSATATLHNERSLTFGVKGQYNPSTDQTTLSLKGSGGTLSLQGNFIGTDVINPTVGGRLLGQAVQ